MVVVVMVIVLFSLTRSVKRFFLFMLNLQPSTQQYIILLFVIILSFSLYNRYLFDLLLQLISLCYVYVCTKLQRKFLLCEMNLNSGSDSDYHEVK